MQLFCFETSVQGRGFKVLARPRDMLPHTYTHMTLVPMKEGRQRPGLYHCCFFVTGWSLTLITQKGPFSSSLAGPKLLQEEVLLITSCPRK